MDDLVALEEGLATVRAGGGGPLYVGAPAQAPCEGRAGRSNA